MNVLVIDIGGTKVKMLATGEEAPRKFESGPTMAPKDLVMQAKKLANGWIYEAISIGYPGVVQTTGLFPSPITWLADGSVLTSKPFSASR